jgi:hypothetical protein
MCMELLQLVDLRIEEAPRPFHVEVATLKFLLARVSDSLEPTEACSSGGPGITPAQSSLPLETSEQKSYMVEEEHLCGCISPCNNPCPMP